ncbi:MAG: ABC transporter permease subunit [Ignavibacteria bacterium]|nr:ABC transporter permease subunit [Ignavibacteria bacterium]
MYTLVKIELYKIFRKWRTYIGFAAIGVMVPIIQIAMYFEGAHYLEFMTRSFKDSFVFVGNLLNGYLIAYIILGSLTIHIPFLIALVAGDLLAGEATAGTYRMLITRPVSRMKLVFAKFIAGLIYTNLLVLFLAVISLGLGLIIFGVGELIVIKDAIIIFAQNDILWRFIFAYASAALSMSVVLALGFLFSSLVENAIGPIVSTMTVIIIFTIFSAINIDFFRTVKPYLFTNYMSTWRLVFDDPIDYNEIIKNCLILAGHIIGFFGITLFIFKRKDILS